MPKALGWLGPLESRLLFAAHDTLYMAVELVEEDREKLALRAMLGVDVVRVTLREDEAEEVAATLFELAAALFGVADRKVGTWKEDTELEGERRGRDEEVVVEVGICKLVLLRIHLRFLLAELLELPVVKTSRCLSSTSLEARARSPSSSLSVSSRFCSSSVVLRVLRLRELRALVDNAGGSAEDTEMVGGESWAGEAFMDRDSASA